MKRKKENSEQSKNFEYRKITREGKEKGLEPVAVEKSYDLIVNGKKIFSITASPTGLEDLGYGYLVCEGFVDSKDKITSVQIKGQEIHALVKGSEKIDEWLELRSSGCVGVDWDKKDKETKIESEFRISSDLVFQSLKHLKTEVYEKTSGTHSSTLLDKNGDPIAKAVDVGRHNTFDKVIGKALRKDTNFSETLLIASGRQSAGMVMKAVRVGIPIIITKAAPISSGIEAAKEKGLTLVCFADGKKFNIFSGSQRIKH